MEVLPEQLDVTGGGPHEREKHPDRSALSSAVGTKKSEHVATPDVEIEIPDCPEGGELFSEIDCPKDGIHTRESGEQVRLFSPWRPWCFPLCSLRLHANPEDNRNVRQEKHEDRKEIFKLNTNPVYNLCGYILIEKTTAKYAKKSTKTAKKYSD